MATTKTWTSLALLVDPVPLKAAIRAHRATGEVLAAFCACIALSKSSLGKIPNELVDIIQDYTFGVLLYQYSTKWHKLSTVANNPFEADLGIIYTLSAHPGVHEALLMASEHYCESCQELNSKTHSRGYEEVGRHNAASIGYDAPRDDSAVTKIRCEDCFACLAYHKKPTNYPAFAELSPDDIVDLDNPFDKHPLRGKLHERLMYYDDDILEECWEFRDRWENEMHQTTFFTPEDRRILHQLGLDIRVEGGMDCLFLVMSIMPGGILSCTETALTDINAYIGQLRRLHKYAKTWHLEPFCSPSFQAWVEKVWADTQRRDGPIRLLELDLE